MIKIGIVGCGAIGSAIGKAIKKRFGAHARLAFVSDMSDEQIAQFRKKVNANIPAISVNHLIEKCDFIIEAASQDAAKAVIPKVLKLNKQALILSVGGVLQIKNLERLVRKSRGCIYIPSGAIAGVDALLACRGAAIKRVRITTRKPIKSLVGAPFLKKLKGDLTKIRKTTLVFEGTAEEAVKCFPQNINVAATLSLAGVGAKRTLVRIYTSPTYRFNTHEIEIEGAFGQIHCKVTNVPSEENPKTSALAIGSAIATLEKIFSRLKIGT